MLEYAPALASDVIAKSVTATHATKEAALRACIIISLGGAVLDAAFDNHCQIACACRWLKFGFQLVGLWSSESVERRFSWPETSPRSWGRCAKVYQEHRAFCVIVNNSCNRNPRIIAFSLGGKLRPVL